MRELTPSSSLHYFSRHSPLTACARNLLVGEDERLRKTADDRGAPGACDHQFGAAGRPTAVGQREANGLIAVYGCDDQHVRRQVGTQNLHELDCLTQDIAAVEAVGDIPGQLWQNSEETGDQVTDAQVK